MTEITLYNTRSRRKDRLVPLDPGNVRMYVCGPTVYDRAHIGNARPVVVFDVLFRLLRHVYGEGHVTYVRNFTDVDDKINARAAQTRHPGETELQAIRRITDETIAWYHADMDALGALRPTHEPRATAFIAPMVAMIETLIAKGNAYVAEGHVLFEVATDPAYGTLARRNLDEMRAGARVEVAPYKRDPMDFVLWKPSAPTEPGWPSPWGRGRPGWHIECSAMAHDLLGPSFDIHGGGIDLAFPHHENEAAQSRCAHPEGTFANIWMHNGFLQVEGEKMSKSLGNFFTVRDLLDRGIPGEVIRFVLLSTHYRQPIDWTERRVEEARATLQKWKAAADTTPSGEPDEEFVDALSDDLNTVEAIERAGELFKADQGPTFTASLRLLGLDLTAMEWARRHEQVVGSVGVVGWGHIPEAVADRCSVLVRRWLEFREAKDWASADALRDRAKTVGVQFEARRSTSTGVSGTAVLRGEIDLAQLEAIE